MSSIIVNSFFRSGVRSSSGRFCVTRQILHKAVARTGSSFASTTATTIGHCHYLYYDASYSERNHRYFATSTTAAAKTNTEDDDEGDYVEITQSSGNGIGVDKKSKTTTTSRNDKGEIQAGCGDEGQENDDEMEKEEMWVEPDACIGAPSKEWGGPRRGGRFPEPTRYKDWERKGRCTDF